MSLELLFCLLCRFRMSITFFVHLFLGSVRLYRVFSDFVKACQSEADLFGIIGIDLL